MTTAKNRSSLLFCIAFIFLITTLSLGCSNPDPSTPAGVVSSPPSEPTSLPDQAAEPKLTKTATQAAESTTSPDESGEEDMYPDIDLCDLDPSLVSNPLRLVGEITFLDEANPEGVYFDVEKDGCQVGVWLDQTTYEGLNPEQRDLLTMGCKLYVQGELRLEGEEYMLDFHSLGEPVLPATHMDLTEEWWTHPQSYHIGENPHEGYVPEMNITALHDWATLGEAFAPHPQEWAAEEEIMERWNKAHQEGMRVEAVLSVIDMWFIEYGPEDEVYAYSGINLLGDHIEYNDPVGFVGCTNQHGWQEFTKERIFKAIDWGVDGIIIDDYEGTSRWTSGVGSGMAGAEHGPGGCFCEACEEGFREYLQGIYSEDQLASFGIQDIETFDYSDYLLERGWTMEELGAQSTKFSGWDPAAEIVVPLYQEYADFQNQEVVEFLAELKEESISYASEKYNKEISWSLNASEVTYGAHKYYELFHRNIGGINYFGYPPLGTEGYFYRLGYNIHGNPRLRDVPRHEVVVAVMNEYQTNNLWSLKGAEAYANQGALIEPDFFVIEGVSDEEALSSLHNDPEAKNAYNSFILEQAELFEFQSLTTLAKTAVLYSSPSIHYDMYRHTQSFNGICEILTDLHVQFDPLFIGDGIASPDNLDGDLLQPYDVIILPNVSALTASQADALLDFMASGGAVIGLGRLGELDEHGEALTHEMLRALKSDPLSLEGEGQFLYSYDAVSRREGIADEDFHDPAAMYYAYYIENNHPAVEEFLYLIEEQLTSHISDAAAAEIRSEISALVEQTLDTRVVADTLSENIGVQVYQQMDPAPKIILHLLNYNYELETDTVIEQEEIQVALEAPDSWEVSRVSLISPDFDGEQDLDFVFEDGYLRFTVPGLYIWDVVVIE